MRPRFWIKGIAMWVLLILALPGTAAETATSAEQSYAERNLREYFAEQTSVIRERCLADVRSFEDWQSRREEHRRQLQEMLGLWPLPEKTDLHPVITGTIEKEDFRVENLHFQAMPHLYVTANLYLPKTLTKPVPAILYVCGHARVFTNGVSYGNKTAYQHHGIWFARNGYACLVIDTLQLGEIEGLHHGTYREGQWWWNSRGYTPAGVEAWFGIRALDYLCSRPEVDKERIGMTGRSGGGSYTWTVSALDDRVKVAAPVAGITDLENQVVDGVIEGHCDCMFFLNTYRWDFPQVAALLAPRPLLIANSDKDSIFPLDGVVRLHREVRRIYELAGKPNQLGLLISDGPHSDTQDLQLPVFRWFNRFLKGEDPPIEMAAKRMFEPQQLRVFTSIPKDQINTRIQETFVPSAASTLVAAGAGSIDLQTLREKVFGGWPDEGPVIAPELTAKDDRYGIHLRCYSLNLQPGVELFLYVVRDSKVRTPGRVVMEVVDSDSWSNSPASSFWSGTASVAGFADLRKRMQQDRVALAFFAPRLVEPAKAFSDKAKWTHIRRRYMLLGQTLDGMRVWDIRCAAQALASLPEFRKVGLWVRARGQMGVNAAYAALYEPQISKLQLIALPSTQAAGPDYLEVLRYTDIQQVLGALNGRLE
jgi:dienelactone hydrolase